MTDIYCTRCNKEFEEYENVGVITSGMVESGLAWPDDFTVTLSDGPHIETLCKKCYHGARRPSRVVVEVMEGKVTSVRAERPGEIVVAVLDHDVALDYDSENRPIPAEVWGTDDYDKIIGSLTIVGKQEEGDFLC